MRQAKKRKDKTAIALVLCFCMMALVSVFAVIAAIDKVQNNMKDEMTADVIKKKSVNQDTPQNEEIIDSETDNNSVSHSSSQYILPLKGEIIMEYSTDMPIYWKTLDQYMTHAGIDIAAPLNEDVYVVAGGTVTKIEENDKLGTLVEVNHGNGMISVYGNLSNDGLVELGEVISKGDVIGLVGQTSMFEFNSPSHLHFEMIKNGNHVNPKDYLPF